MSAEEQRAVRLEAVKKCMAIESVEEFNMMLEELSRYVKVESVRNPMLGEDMDEEEMEPQEENYDVEYDPDRVVECLMNFVNPSKKVERQQILGIVSAHSIYIKAFLLSSNFGKEENETGKRKREKGKNR